MLCVHKSDSLPHFCHSPNSTKTDRVLCRARRQDLSLALTSTWLLEFALQVRSMLKRRSDITKQHANDYVHACAAYLHQASFIFPLIFSICNFCLTAASLHR